MAVLAPHDLVFTVYAEKSSSGFKNFGTSSGSNIFTFGLQLWSNVTSSRHTVFVDFFSTAIAKMTEMKNIKDNCKFIITLISNSQLSKEWHFLMSVNFFLCQQYLMTIMRCLKLPILLAFFSLISHSSSLSVNPNSTLVWETMNHQGPLSFDLIQPSSKITSLTWWTSSSLLLHQVEGCEGLV